MKVFDLHQEDLHLILPALRDAFNPVMAKLIDRYINDFGGVDNMRFSFDSANEGTMLVMNLLGLYAELKDEWWSAGARGVSIPLDVSIPRLSIPNLITSRGGIVRWDRHSSVSYDSSSPIGRDIIKFIQLLRM